MLQGGYAAFPNLEACRKCEKGTEIMKTLKEESRNPAEKQKRHKKPGKKSVCRWPGCERPTIAHGVCKEHYQNLYQNNLIRANTRGNLDRCGPLVDTLAKAAEETGLHMDDVVFMALIDGLANYMKRRKTAKPKKLKQEKKENGSF